MCATVFATSTLESSSKCWRCYGNSIDTLVDYGLRETFLSPNSCTLNLIEIIIRFKATVG